MASQQRPDAPSNLVPGACIACTTGFFLYPRTVAGSLHVPCFEALLAFCANREGEPMNAADQRTLFSSAQHEWRTPPDLFAALDDEFQFDLDLAASDENHLCERYYTEARDAFGQPWDGTCYLNPPYGRGQSRWLAYAQLATLTHEAETVVILIPARTDTAAWHDYAMHADEIRLIRGRLKFLDGTGALTAPAPFPSALIIYREYPRYVEGPRIHGWSVPRIAALRSAVPRPTADAA